MKVIYFFLKLRLINKHSLFITFLFLSFNTVHSQELYIINYEGIKSAEECYCNFFLMRIESYGKEIYPISVNGNFYLFDKKPTYFFVQAYRPDTYLCGGFCNDGLEINDAKFFNANCSDSVLMSNQVLVPPGDGITNSFCDKLTLTAVGCPGTQRFFWEYSTDGINYNKTNVSTGINENYQFVKSSYLPNDYLGNIYFRTLIDSDPWITSENIYSNAVNYSITSCSPELVEKKPSTTKPKCISESSGSATIKFKTDLKDNDQFLFNLYIYKPADGFVFWESAFKLKKDIKDKTFTWDNLAHGSYIIKYQAQSINDKNDKIGSSAISTDSFIIEDPSPLTFTAKDVQPKCNTDKGVIIITATGGTSPYYYILNNQTKKELTTNPYTIENLPDGGYSIIVLDSNNCIEK